MHDDFEMRRRPPGPSSPAASGLPSDTPPAWVRRLWVAFLVAFGIGAALLLTSCGGDDEPTGPDAIAYFGEVDHAFPSKAITDDGPKRSRVSRHVDHPFRSMAITRCEGATGSA